MQDLKNTATNTMDELAEVFTEMRAHLYLYAGTLLLKRAQDGAQQWRAVLDLAALCYLVSYQVRRFLFLTRSCRVILLLTGSHPLLP